MKINKLYVLLFAIVAIFTACNKEPLKKIDFDVKEDATKLPQGIKTLDVVEDYGISTVISGSLESLGEDTVLYDLGFITSNSENFDIESPNSKIGSVGSKNLKSGEFIAEIKGLKLNTKYFYRAFAQNKNGVVYGDIKSFTTSNAPVFRTPYTSDFKIIEGTDSITTPTRKYWKLGDNLTGYLDSDNVFWFDIGPALKAPELGSSVVVYCLSEPARLVSPKFKIANKADTLAVKLYAGAFKQNVQSHSFNIYVTESLDNLGEPVKSYGDLKAGHYSGGLKFAVGDKFYNKQVYIVFEVIKGNVTFYRFSLSNVTDPKKLFK